MIIFSSICNSKRLAVGLCPDPLRELRTLPQSPQFEGWLPRMESWRGRQGDGEEGVEWVGLGRRSDRQRLCSCKNLFKKHWTASRLLHSITVVCPRLLTVGDSVVFVFCFV